MVDLIKMRTLADAGVPVFRCLEDASDVFDDGFLAVQDSVALESAPSLQRLGELLQERGWTGLHRFEPADDSTAR